MKKHPKTNVETEEEGDKPVSSKNIIRANINKVFAILTTVIVGYAAELPSKIKNFSDKMDLVEEVYQQNTDLKARIETLERQSSKDTGDLGGAVLSVMKDLSEDIREMKEQQEKRETLSLMERIKDNFKKEFEVEKTKSIGDETYSESKAYSSAPTESYGSFSYNSDDEITIDQHDTIEKEEFQMQQQSSLDVLEQKVNTIRNRGVKK